MKFWIRINGLQEGPMDKEQLKAQNITPTTYVWCAGMKDWAYARDVADLQDIISANGENDVQESLATETAVTSETDADTSAEQPCENATENAAAYEPVAESPVPQKEQAQNDPYTALETPVAEAKPVEERPCPPNNLIWAILITILCCQPLGILAIVFSAQVNSKYYESGYDAAKKYSDWSAILCIASVVLVILSVSLFPALIFLASL